MLKKIVIALFLVSATANSASFDCAKATSKAEKLICSTPALSQADDVLYVDYLQAKVVTGNSDDFKALVKQNWKLRENNCDTKECLLNWYKRSAELYRQIAAGSGKEDTKSSQVSRGQQVDEFGLPAPKNNIAYNNYMKMMFEGLSGDGDILDRSNVMGTFTGTEIYADYESNLLSASKKYTGKKIRITGTINSVGTDYSDEHAVVNVSGDSANIWDTLSIVSLYADKNDDYVYGLKKNGKVDMVCVGAGAGDMDEPLFTDCVSYDAFVRKATNIENAFIYSLYMSNENIMSQWCAKSVDECKDNIKNGKGGDTNKISANVKAFVLKYDKQLTAKYGRVS
ncbi:hypothetical protein [Photorhabdus sp. RM71S]|uniref:OB-fold protein n=1 Tax=Photorhabdus sp. RM71S TaxID=3342824 RepID=UPI0036DB4516